MKWIDAGPQTALIDGETLSLAVGRCMVAVARSGADYFAIEGDEIICPRHGARFCLRTGEALTPPAYESVRVFETKLDSGRVWVLAD